MNVGSTRWDEFGGAYSQKRHSSDDVMLRRPLICAQIITWAVALGAVGAVAVAYDSLPDVLPVTRWINAPKSPLLAVRIPLINVLSVGLIELLTRGLHRSGPAQRADAVAIVLLLTAAAKACIEATGILLLPTPFSWTLAPLSAVLMIGLGTSIWLGRQWLHAGEWRQATLTGPESLIAAALVAGIVALQLIPYRPG